MNYISRQIIADGLQHYKCLMDKQNLLDHEGISALALELIEKNLSGFHQFRAVLSDEVQDLSEIDLALLSNLNNSNGIAAKNSENGLFLTGDGAQSIYKRGFALRTLGINITGRSYVLKKNYRNTNEILKAAFGLVQQYEFADEDEENICKPSQPDFAKRHGSQPLILRCDNTNDEIKYIASEINSLIGMGQTPGQICIISPSSKMREEIKLELQKLRITYSDLRQDVDYESDNVKIITIESAKGHEFGSVFISGLVEGIIPGYDVSSDEIPREAARLYVAMTRARDNLTLTYSSTQTHPSSRFLTAVQQNCREGILKRDGAIRPIEK